MIAVHTPLTCDPYLLSVLLSCPCTMPVLLGSHVPIPTSVKFRSHQHATFSRLAISGTPSALHVTEHAMYGRHLEVVELREKAFAARERAEKARRLAARTSHKPASFDHYAAELDARAVTLEQRIEQFRTKR